MSAVEDRQVAEGLLRVWWREEGEMARTVVLSAGLPGQHAEVIRRVALKSVRGHAVAVRRPYSLSRVNRCSFACSGGHRASQA